MPKRLDNKHELSEAEIRRQAAVLDQLTLDVPHTLKVDASQPVAELAAAVMGKIAAIAGRGPAVAESE
jgi:hypothetical protein